MSFKRYIERIIVITMFVIPLSIVGIIILFLAVCFLDMTDSKIGFRRLAQRYCGGTEQNFEKCLGMKLHGLSPQQVHQFLARGSDFNLSYAGIDKESKNLASDRIRQTRAYETYDIKPGLLAKICIMPTDGIEIFYDDKGKVSAIDNDLNIFTLPIPFIWLWNDSCYYSFKQTRLYWAVLDNDIKTIRELINAKVDINREIQAGLTALHLAAMNGDTDVTKELIKAGANVDAGIEGKYLVRLTPIFYAALNGNNEALKLLIKSGAHVNVIDVSDTTPMKLALRNRYFDIAKILQTAGAIISKEGLLALSVYSGDIGEIKKLIDSGMKVNVTWPDSHNDPIIHYAVWGNQLETAKLLLSKGAYIDSRNYEGWTPLMIAASQGNKEMVIILVENGADFDCVSYLNQYNAIDYAIKTGHPGIAAMLKELRAKKAK